MNYLKKTLLQILLLLLIPVAAVAQDNKTVTLNVSAQGKTISEAKQNALRDAIEQAFGTFVSSNTEILNDELVKDEIVSVSNGNIQDYKVISEVQLPDGSFATTLKATVSVTKLTSFVESKGVEAELKGNLFAFNIKQQELNELNEKKAVDNITNVTLKLLENSFYGTISPKEPFLKKENVYTLPYLIEIHSSKNTNSAVTYFIENISQLSMNEEDKTNYLKLNKPIYDVALVYTTKPISGKFEYVLYDKLNPKFNNFFKRAYKFSTLYFRNEVSKELLERFTFKAIKNIFNFKIKSQLTLNIDEIKTIKVDSRIIGEMNDRTLAGGFVPFSSPSFRDYRDYVDYFVGYNFSDFQVPLSLAPKKYSLLEGLRIGYKNPKNINNKLGRRYGAGRTFGNVMLTHKYIEDGLIYEINGSTDLTLKELSKISTLRIEY